MGDGTESGTGTALTGTLGAGPEGVRGGRNMAAVRRPRKAHGKQRGKRSASPRDGKNSGIELISVSFRKAALSKSQAE